MPPGKNLRAVADRIEGLVGEFGTLTDPSTRDKAEELVRLLLEFYGAGLQRIIEIVEQDESLRPLLNRLADDELVASILLLHGLHPVAVETRVKRALDRVRPYLGSHGGGVQLLGVDDGVVRLRLEGSCHGCGASTTTVNLAVETAILEAAPEVTRVEVEGMVDPAPSPLLQLTRSESNGSWLSPDDPLSLASGELKAIELKGEAVVVCCLGESLYAYRDSCPSCGAALETGQLQAQVLTCASCGQRYDMRRAGVSLDRSGLQLEPLPLLAEDGAVKIALPAATAS